MSWLDGNYLSEIKEAVWFAVLKILNPEIDLRNIYTFEQITEPEGINWTFPPEKIRHSYQKEQPEFKRDDNIVFIYLSEINDDYGKLADMTLELNEAQTDLIRRIVRRIVFNANFIAYGDLGYKIINKIKDSLFEEEIKRTLKQKGIFIVPDLNNCVHAPEHFGGQWWERWDWNTRLNYLHVSENENIGGLTTFDPPIIVLNIDK